MKSQSAAWILLMVGASVGNAQIDTARLQRVNPNLITSAGVPTGFVDRLLFARDPQGKNWQLLAGGEDKQVHTADIEENNLIVRPKNDLRWPAGRQQSGSIYCMDVSPVDSRYLAIAGYGIRIFNIAVIDRVTGKIIAAFEATKPDLLKTGAVWAVRFSPDGKDLAFGRSDGGVGICKNWQGNDRSVRWFDKSFASVKPANGVNRVRLLEFQSTGLLTVTQDGRIRRWALDQESGDPSDVIASDYDSVFRASLSADQRTLVIVPERKSATRAMAVEVLDLGQGTRQYLELPADARGESPSHVAINQDRSLLAVGSRQTPATAGAFFMETDGIVRIYDLRAGKFLPDQLRTGPVLESLAFHPEHKNVLAVAGGRSHQLRLWNVTQPGDHQATATQAIARIPFAVRFAKKGGEIAIQTKAAPAPSHPNQRGEGPWSVFSFSSGDYVNDSKTFEELPALDEHDGWKIEATADFKVWRIVHPGGQQKTSLEGSLYNTRVNDFPACYTFVPPSKNFQHPRLIVGHLWGASVYDLTPEGVRLRRVLRGQAGRVTCLAVSPDGDSLVTGGTDFVLCGFSLNDWTSQPELGASFEAREGRLFAKSCDTGSPAWEMGIDKNDEIAGVLDATAGKYWESPDFKFNKQKQARLLPSDRAISLDELTALLSSSPVQHELFFYRKPAGGKSVFDSRTYLMQRPVWQMLPAADGEYVAWASRDGHYTSNFPNPDRLVGWHVNDGVALDATPAFHPLSHFPSRRQDKKMLALMSRFADDPNLELLAKVEPPRAGLKETAPKNPDQPWTFVATGQPRGALGDIVGGADLREIVKATLYLNESFILREWPSKEGRLELASHVFEAEVSVALSTLRPGMNRVRLVVENRGGAIGTAESEISHNPGQTSRRNLHMLHVGVSKLADNAPADLKASFDPLPEVDKDTNSLRELLDQRKSGFGKINPRKILDESDEKSKVEAWLAETEKTVVPDDLALIWLSGHGYMHQHEDGNKTWAFLTHEGKRIDGEYLAEAVSRLNCRKLLIIDSCHSGGVFNGTSTVARPFAAGGRPSPLIITSCADHQSAWATAEGGLFTQSILEFSKRNQVTTKSLLEHLGRDVPRRYGLLLKNTDPSRPVFNKLATQGTQTPRWFPNEPGGEHDFEILPAPPKADP